MSPSRFFAAAWLALLLGLLGVTPAAAQDANPPRNQTPQAEPSSPESVPASGPESTFVPAPDRVPDVNVDFGGDDDDSISRTVTTVILVGIASVAPALVLLMTTFTRFIIVLGLTKNALALQTVPPSQVLVGLALFLTAFVMSPVFTQINDEAVQPFLNEEMEQGDAMAAAWDPLKQFMLVQTRDEDLQLFIDMASSPPPATAAEVPATTLIPAFVISELRTGFIIGFVVFVPFLLIDLVVAAVLMSMGMVMVPPVFISLPLKLLLFVLVDGWVLMIGSMVQSVGNVGLA